jgi:hypothetical protein
LFIEDIIVALHKDLMNMAQRWRITNCMNLMEIKKKSYRKTWTNNHL